MRERQLRVRRHRVGIVQRAAHSVPLDERAVRHARVPQHEVRPHAPDERQRGPSAVRREVRLELEPRDEGRHHARRFGHGGPIRAPTHLECFGDLGDLRRVGDEPGLNRPRVPVLRRQRRRLVIAEQPHVATVSATRRNIPTTPRR